MSEAVGTIEAPDVVRGQNDGIGTLTVKVHVEEQPAVDTSAAEVRIHRAVCLAPGCDVKVTYRPTASGGGFIVLERSGVAIDAAFGIGHQGHPVCPRDGHGEMALADEQLPASEAITRVAEKVGGEAQATKLPFPAPPFNDANALAHIFEKRHEVKALEEKHEELAERKKKAKEQLDDANAQLGENDRRLRRAEGGTRGGDRQA